MQKLKLLLPLALFLGVFFVACHEDEPFGEGPAADVTFVGQIIDEGGNAVQGALVKAGGESAVTDANGAFRLQSVRLPAMHALVSVSKNGYFEVSRPYIVEDEALQTITIQLLQKIQVGLLSSGTGGEVNVPGGVKLTFPANAVSDQNGNAYTGTVRVFARYLDPSDPSLALQLPGDMTAENAADEEVFLATYGMVGVEIEDVNGNTLKIAAGKEVELRMPILASQAASAPASIPLWHYDLEDGHWHEEGSAQKVGNEYVGKVQHFSFWNCDAPFPLTQLHGKVFLENTSQPLANACVRITMLSTGASSFGYTDGDGHYGGCVPKNENLKLEVIDPVLCGNQAYHTENVGPFTGVTTLPDIIIPSSAQLPLLKVSGKLVDCSGQPVSNGYVKVELDGQKRYLFTKPDATFAAAVVNCAASAQTGEVIGYDLSNLLESSPVAISIPPNTLNLGNIAVCNTLDEYIQFEIDGQTFTKVDVRGGLDVSWTLVASQDSSLNGGSIHMGFENNGQLGTFPVQSMIVNQLFFDIQLPNTLSTTVTTYGAIGGYIVGSFGGNFQSFGGSNHTINGNYRVKRSW